MPTISVVTISTGNASLLTQQAAATLTSGNQLVLRTSCTPIAGWLASQGVAYQTLDALHESSEDFDCFNQTAATQLWHMAQSADLTYGVFDACADTTVAALQATAPEGARIEILPGISHLERCLALLGAQRSGMRIYAAEDFRLARVSPEESLFLTELHSRECAGDCKLRLMQLLPENTPVVLVSGTADGALHAATICLYELDRQPHYDHLTACHVPSVSMQDRTRFDMDDLIAVMQRLRAPGGCPWDREQTHESLLPYLLEECYEFIGAAREQDADHMYDELGDVLLQVVFHAEVARQHGTFTIGDVTTAIVQKMVERHTHIFGNAKADTAAQVLTNWDAIKRSQRGITTIAQAMDDVSTGLSATMRAEKVQRKAAKVHFDFPNAQAALEKVHEEAEEVHECLEAGLDPEMELGDLFFSIVNVCRLSHKNPDMALHFATNKFIERFRNMENLIEKAGKSIEHLTLSEMDVYWEAEKQAQPTSEGKV